MVILHKNLEVYKVALLFVEIAAEIIKHIPRGQGYLSSQLKRSAASSVQNIGEGAGEFAKKKKFAFIEWLSDLPPRVPQLSISFIGSVTLIKYYMREQRVLWTEK